MPSEAIIKIEQPSPLISQEPSLIHQNSPVTSMDSSGPPDYHQLRMSTSAFSIIPQSIPLTAAAAFSHRGYVPNSRPTGRHFLFRVETYILIIRHDMNVTHLV